MCAYNWFQDRNDLCSSDFIYVKQTFLFMHVWRVHCICRLFAVWDLFTQSHTDIADERKKNRGKQLSPNPPEDFLFLLMLTQHTGVQKAPLAVCADWGRVINYNTHTHTHWMALCDARSENKVISCIGMKINICIMPTEQPGNHPAFKNSVLPLIWK